MSDALVGPQEVSLHIYPAEQRVQDDPRASMTTGELIRFEPMTPDEIAYAIQECQAALDRYLAYLPTVLKEVHDAERAYIAKKARMRLEAPGGGYDRDRAAYAELHSMDELEARDLAKEKRTVAEELAKVITSKMYAFMNANKTATALMGASHYQPGA